jgi:hypothetical protein
MSEPSSTISTQEPGGRMSDTHNVFISHRHEDDRLVGELKAILEKGGSQIRDSSVDSSNPNGANSEAYIRQLLADQIRWAGTIFVIVSPDTKNHEWVDWEVEYAKRYPDKRIIGIWAPGSTGADLPESMEEFADGMVVWSEDEILAALAGATVWRAPDDTEIEPRSIRRLPC